MKKVFANLLLIIYLFFINAPVCMAIDYTTDDSDDTLTGYIAKIEKGTSFEAYLKDSINTATAEKNDIITAVLTEDWIYNDILIAPQGSLLKGKVSNARAASIGYRNGFVQIDFDTLETPNKEVYKISVEEIDFEVDSEGKFKNAAGKVIRGAILGAIFGLIYTLLADDASKSKSTIIAASAGAATGLVQVGFETGLDAEIPIYTPITLTLDKQFRIMINE